MMKKENHTKEISESHLKEFNHTPEPWRVSAIPDMVTTRTIGMYEIFNKPYGLGIVGYACTAEDAERIAACVNSMKDIENPIKFMEGVNSMLTMIENGGNIDNHSLIFKCIAMFKEKTKAQ